MSAGKYSKPVRIAVSIFALLCLEIVLFYGVNYHSDKSVRPTVKNGILDLTGWDIEKDSPSKPFPSSPPEVSPWVPGLASVLTGN